MNNQTIKCSENVMQNVSGQIFRPEGTRIIYINGVITDELAYQFNLMLLSLEQVSPDEDITVYINSPGGSGSAGLSMIDTMDIVSCDIRTVCVGMAASMGAWLLMCGTKGKRMALPHSKVMLHQPLASMGSGFSQVSDIKLFADEMLRTKNEMFELVAQRTGQSIKKIAKDCERDFTMTSAEALEYGVIDAILKPHRAV